MKINARMKIRRDTAANWTLLNPILADGELAAEVDTRTFKIGDGVTPWNGLLYQLQGAQGIQGLQGLQGAQGAQGIQGLQGEQGLQGIQGLQGVAGNNGVSDVLEFVRAGNTIGALQTYINIPPLNRATLPKLLVTYLRFKVAFGGYVVGDEVCCHDPKIFGCAFSAGSTLGISVVVGVASIAAFPSKATGATAGANAGANYDVVVKAYW